jgi:hypothetical protein
MGDLDMDGRNISKLLLHEEDMKMWAGSIPLGIEFSEGLVTTVIKFKFPVKWGKFLTS